LPVRAQALREKVGTIEQVRIAPGNPQPCPGGMAACSIFAKSNAATKPPGALGDLN
jgi:hypothetical protein